MLQRLIDLWGINELGLIALEYRTDGFDEILAEAYGSQFHGIYTDLCIESLEFSSIVLSPSDGWYLCCTTGDGRPIAIEAAVPLTQEQLEKFSNISEDFYQTVCSILEGEIDG